VAEIHHRMLLIIAPAVYARWLSDELSRAVSAVISFRTNEDVAP